jgi:hypothetical protein
MTSTQKKTPDHIVEAAKKLAETAPVFGAESLARAYRALGLEGIQSSAN